MPRNVKWGLRGPMLNKNQSKKGDGVFDFIVRYKFENDGATPSIREIQAALDIKSTSNVNYIVRGLVYQGRLTLNENKRLCVPGGKWVYGENSVDSSNASPDIAGLVAEVERLRIENKGLTDSLVLSLAESLDRQVYGR